MADYDVIVVGGGINGLTTAAYLGRAGLKVLVLEARGECGAHCDTTEPGVPGFIHNLHATWIITAMSPAMSDLDLPKFGLEFTSTDIVYGKTFKDGKNALLSQDPMRTMESWGRHSAADLALMERAAGFLLPRIEDIVDTLHSYLFQAPSWENEVAMSKFSEAFYKEAGIDMSYYDLINMNGFEAMDRFFESDHVKTLIESLAWISGMPPIHRTVGSMGTAFLSLLTGPFIPVHFTRGGSHAVTHALVKACTSYGVKILPVCPIKKIIVENGEAKGVVLSEHAVYPNETITARKVISNLTVAPTFLKMIGPDVIGPEMAHRIAKFSYSEQNLFGVYYALNGQPRFASEAYDPGIGKCAMGYFGGENGAELQHFNSSLVSGHIHDEIMANYFIPTLADPSQAPPGCHTSFVWTDVPPCPISWKHGRLDGLKSWDKIKEKMADEVTDTYERYAPGFKDLIVERILYTPLDMQRNNPSAIEGNWVGGSVIPEQFYEKRPVPGVCVGGGSRTFIKNLYLSNSIHPFGTTWLSSGYIAACEAGEDLGVRDQDWWTSKACVWYLENMENIPTNLGVK
ncbi:MAG: NAD(P)/FAD-dependent oxidoreductase [Deltaproteobacteria bacterium]|nr:NAD(P)/FAD-dependent oxidoreductase [Deltaproteobacteria bacterium]